MSSDSPFENLIAELKRRRVFRVALAYAAAAFATVSVASDFLPALRLPDWSVTFVAAVTVVGFPIALVIAWLYDITPRGLRRTPADPGNARAHVPVPVQPARALGFVGIGMIISLISVGSLAQFGRLPLLSNNEDVPSIAVLPFQNMSKDSANEFFSGGIHEEVMTQLYKLGGMTVISRTSVMQYRDSPKPIRTVGQELGVSAVLEASVRRDGRRVRLDARLIDARSDRQLWAETYDRELSDVLSIQAEIAEQIAQALHTRLSRSAKAQLATVRERAVDSDMYEVYLRGLYEAGEGDHQTAIVEFKRALSVDPNYAPAHAGIARSMYVLAFFGEIAPVEAFRSLRAAAERALELDPDLADAHATLALYDLHYDWNWKSADRRFQRALRLSPNHAQVRHDYAHYLLAVGRSRESARESSQAARLDPGNSMLKACAGWHDFTDREFDNAVTQSMAALMMMPGAFWPEIILGWAYENRGQHREALASLHNAIKDSKGLPMAVAALAHAQAKAGARTSAQQMLKELLDVSKERYVSAYDIAVVQAGLGDADQTVAWLRRAYDERSAMLVNIGWDPRFDTLRDNPGYREVIARMRLPDRPAPKPAARRAPAPRSM